MADIFFSYKSDERDRVAVALAQHREEAVLVGHEAPIYHASVSPRGDRILTAGFEAAVRG